MNHGDTPPERVFLHLKCIYKHLSGIIREIPHEPMNLLKTLYSNWRDILTFLLIIIPCSFMADWIEQHTLLDSGNTWLNNTVFVFRGTSKLATVSLAAFIMLSVAWPMVNKFNNDHFREAWQNLPQWGRFSTFVGLSIAYLIASAMCFAG